MEGSGIFADCYGFKREVRNTGFLMGNVVDMFKFQANWPEWLPLLGGKEVFPAIWNVADASISTGVIMVFIRQRAYFKGSEKSNKPLFSKIQLRKRKPDLPKNEQ
jgi:signal peptidase II